MKENLKLLCEQYDKMIAYRLKCNATGSSKNYSLTDFDKEGELIGKINKIKHETN